MKQLTNRDQADSTAQELHQLAIEFGVSVMNTNFRPPENSATDLAIPAFTERVPIQFAREKNIVAVLHSGHPTLLTSCEQGANQIENMQRLLRSGLKLMFTTQSEIQHRINHAYQNRTPTTRSAVASIYAGTNRSSTSELADDLLESDQNSPVVHLVNSALCDAIMQRASDVHFQPMEDRMMIRFRVDGELYDLLELPKASQEEILSRIKVFAKMNIAEKRLPQDGRASVRFGERLIDLRIASLPTQFGERIVIRLLEKNSNLLTLDEIGMSDGTLETFRKMIGRKHGMVLVTGPTGGGKSTTLYAALREMNTTERNVLTLEDPIEYQLPGVSQTQVNQKKGMTFAMGLRNILRQDPDIIMIGEIRDRETAEMAIQSALTGHLVLSTLHTNDAASSIARLLDLGIEPFLVASSVVGVIAQRLVRRICSSCVSPSDHQSQSPNRLGKDWYDPAQKLSMGTGCEKCRNTGYRGRTGVYELLEIQPDLQTLIQKRGNASQIRQLAQSAGGMRLLHEDGLEKIRQGQTTVDEIVKLYHEAN